ncbi:MAG: formylmethanofuran dehydrogenase subunit B [Candidatus Jordarchaeales archaeon]
MPREVITDVVCPVCGSLCDDISVIFGDGGRIIEVENACSVGASKFLSAQSEHRLKTPLMRKNGSFVEVSLEKAVKETAKLLANAERPLLYGWSNAECDAHRVGLELAEEVGGIIDSTTTTCHGPSVLAIQEVGCPTCTLGEVKNRADVIIYWGANPIHAHPRHMSRYTTFPRGFFREKGEKDRTIIVIDVRRTDTAKLADYFLQVKPGYDYEIVAAMRALLKGHSISVSEVGGVPTSKIKEVVEVMKNAGFGALFFGMGLTMTRGKHRNIDNAISLIADLNSFAKWILMPMRGHYNVSGTGETFSWVTGYPFAIDFQRGFPYYNPGETTAIDLLMRGEVDAALIVASDPVSHFPAAAVKHLTRIPVSTIEPHPTPTVEISKIVIPPAIAGIEAEGTAYRMDHVPIRLRKIMNPPEGCLPDKEILEMILDEVRKIKK